MDDVAISMLKLAHKGYSCSQIIMLLDLDARGEANPALVRAMAGPAYGCGGGRGNCGALTGACCLIGLYAGKGADNEEESPKLMPMLQEFSDWFQEQVGGRYGGIVCETIVGDDGPAASRQKCGTIVAESYSRVLELLAENGFDIV